MICVTLLAGSFISPKQQGCGWFWTSQALSIVWMLVSIFTFSAVHEIQFHHDTHRNPSIEVQAVLAGSSWEVLCKGRAEQPQHPNTVWHCDHLQRSTETCGCQSAESTSPRGARWQIHMLQRLVALITKYCSQILESFNWLQICKPLRTESTESNDMIKVNIRSKGGEPFN